MSRWAVLPVLLAAWPAWAGSNDVTLSGMLEHEGIRASGVLEDEYKDLIGDLGAAVALPAMLPADTLGFAEFDIALYNSFVFIDAYTEGEVTAWQRATTDDEPGTYLFFPGFSARKGLPMSFEIGMNGSWMGMTNQGTFGGFVRSALVEGYKPYPDFSFHAGYSGYVANNELDLGVWDFGATIGSQFRLNRFAGITFSKFSPWFDASLLSVRAAPRIDAETAALIGAVAYGGSDDDAEAALYVPRFSGGFQLTTNKTIGRLAFNWVPTSAPTLTFAIGFEI